MQDLRFSHNPCILFDEKFDPIKQKESLMAVREADSLPHQLVTLVRESVIYV